MKELNETEQAIIKTLTFLEYNAKTENVIYQTAWKFVPISDMWAYSPSTEAKNYICRLKREEEKLTPDMKHLTVHTIFL